MTEEMKGDNWQDKQLSALYNAILERMVFTYMLNELVKSGVKTPMKEGIIVALREMQKQRNFVIRSVVNRIDRGVQS